MDDESTTREEHISEVERLRRRIAELEGINAERKEMEKALSEREQRYALAVSGGKVGVWDWNLETNEIYLDPILKAMLGFEDREIQNHLDDWGKRVHPDDAERVGIEAARHIEGKSPEFLIEHRMICKDGSIRWYLARGTALLDTSGKPCRIVGTDTDITERKKVEEALQEAYAKMEQRIAGRTAELAEANARLCREIADRERANRELEESRERFLQLAENIEEVFYVSDLRARQMLYISPAYEKVWGGSCQSLYENPLSFLDVIHPEDRPKVLESLEKQGRGEQTDTDYRLRLPDGSVRWIHDRAYPLRNDRGEVFRVTGIAEDITRRRQLETQAQQHSRLAAVGQLAAGIAHDFNNLLTVIMGTAQILEMHKDLSPAARESMELIFTQGQRAAQLVRQILDFSRVRVVQRHPVSLVPFMKETLKMLERTLPEHIRIVSDFDDKEHVIDANLVQLQQVITNLAINARDAMPNGGLLRFAVFSLPLLSDQSPPWPGMAQGNWTVLTVSDQGTGMSKEVMERIFEPFFTTKESGQGTGLGLAQVYGIVKQHGGYIDAESQPGEGATFTIYLPEIDEAGIFPPKLQNAVCLGNNETILVVEDDAQVLEVIKSILEKINYRVITASNGKKALEVFYKHREDVDLILTDLVMPEMGGGELFCTLRQRGFTLPVVAMTGYSRGSNPHAQFLDEMDGLVEKPLELGMVTQVIAGALGK